MVNFLWSGDILKFSIFIFCVLISITISSVTAYEPTDSIDFQQFYLNSTSSSRYITPNIYTPPPPPFPSFGTLIQNSKILTSISSRVDIGGNLRDPFTGKYGGGFEFPNQSGTDYLFLGGLWIGGIIGDDTLVTTSYSKELLIDSVQNLTYISYINELHGVDALEENKSTDFYHRDYGNLFHSTSIDTFTTGIANINPYYSIFGHHRPMNIEVITKSYVKNIPPYKNIVLLDFTITNHNTQMIKDAYVGMYIDADIYSDCNNYGNPFGLNDHADDLAGSLRDIGTMYFIDCDGNLTSPECMNKNPSGALAVKPVSSFPPASDTTFNWWVDYNVEFGPRKKGTPSDPYRNFGLGVIGTPTYDSNKYYIMSHPEWDYDQYLTNSIPFLDTTWILPDTHYAADIANGEDTKGLLAIGPYELLPDSSIRVIFALFGGEMVHLDPDNWINFEDSNYSAYYDNLYFQVVRDNAFYADQLTELYLNPLHAPSGLRVNYISADSVRLHWDRFVYPDVESYNVYIKEIPDSLLLARKFLRPDVKFDDLPTETIYFHTNDNSLITSDLSPSSVYYCRISQNSFGNESDYSDPILIGQNNPYTTPEPVYPSLQFSPIYPEYKKLVLQWNYPDSGNILYYKIYRSRDSAAAFQRYYPFLYDHPNDIPFQYQHDYFNGDDSVYFYEWRAYDSTDVNEHRYIDNLTQKGYYYWITAVNSDHFESDFSPLIKAVTVPAVTKDIVVLLGSTGDEQDYAYEDSISQYYSNLLSGYKYDLYYWTDSNLTSSNCATGFCTTWDELSKYKLIMIEEYPASKILTTPNESNHKLFTHLSDIGQNIAYFGIPPGDESIGLSTHTDEIDYGDLSFENKYMGISKTFLRSWFNNYNQFETLDTLGGFTRAEPAYDDLPVLHTMHLNTVVKPFFRQLFDITDNLPFTAAFEKTADATVLYRYQSLFPESSELQDLPVGVMRNKPNNTVFSFGFHLWGIERNDARSLVDYLFNQQTNHPDPYIVPNKVTLNQNFPNPFNATTKISFSLPLPSVVSLDIYNILGQKIKTLAYDQILQTGNHYFTWDGTNEKNREVATGIYFYRLRVNNITMTHKMVLIK